MDLYAQSKSCHLQTLFKQSVSIVRPTDWLEVIMTLQ